MDTKTMAMWKQINPTNKLRFFVDVWSTSNDSNDENDEKNQCRWDGMLVSAKQAYKTFLHFKNALRSTNDKVVFKNARPDFRAKDEMKLVSEWIEWAKELTNKQWAQMGLPYPPLFYVTNAYDKTMTLRVLVAVPAPDVSFVEYAKCREIMDGIFLTVPLNVSVLSTEEHQGPRSTMEDAWFHYETDHWNMYGVCDGHGGADVSRKLSHERDGIGRFLASQLTDDESFKAYFDQGSPNSVKAITKHLRKACVEYDQDVLMPLKYAQGCGSTCVMAVISKVWRHMWIVHVGDARALLVDHVNGHMFQTSDHKPNDAKEKKRITDAGANVVNADGIYRVHVPDYAWDLSLARAFGDWGAKKYHGKSDAVHGAISSTPDVAFIDMTQRACDLVLACDGLWDGMTAHALKIIVCKKEKSKSLRVQQTAPQVSPSKTISAEWIKQAYDTSTDNITLVWLRIV